MLKICKKLQEKRFVFVKILAIIIPENGEKVSKIMCLRLNQQTLSNNLTHRVTFNIIVSNRISQFCIYYNIQEIGIDFCVQAKMIP